MRKILLAMIALGAMTVAAQAQPKPAAGTQQVFWVITLGIQPSQYDQFEQLVGKIVAAVEKEPGTLEYEWNVSADHSSVDVVERYADSNAVLQHIHDFGPFAKEFFGMAKTTHFVVFGSPDDAAKQALKGLNPIYMTTFDGFTR